MIGVEAALAVGVAGVGLVLVELNAPSATDLAS